MSFYVVLSITRSGCDPSGKPCSCHEENLIHKFYVCFLLIIHDKLHDNLKFNQRRFVKGPKEITEGSDKNRIHKKAYEKEAPTK